MSVWILGFKRLKSIQLTVFYLWYPLGITRTKRCYWSQRISGTKSIFFFALFSLAQVCLICFLCHQTASPWFRISFFLFLVIDFGTYSFKFYLNKVVGIQLTFGLLLNLNLILLPSSNEYVRVDLHLEQVSRVGHTDVLMQLKIWLVFFFFLNQPVQGSTNFF